MAYTLVQGNPWDYALGKQLHQWGAVHPRILDKQFYPEQRCAVYRVEVDTWVGGARHFMVCNDERGDVSVAEVIPDSK